MYVVVVKFTLDPRNLDCFMEEMLLQARTSLRVEEGCLQFDVCQSSNNPEKILLYEVYADAVAFSCHLASKHFKEFDATVAPWIVDKKVATLKRVLP